MNRVVALFLCLLVAAPAAGQQKRPMQVDDLFRFKRVSDPQISPDGKWIAYTITTVEDVDSNKRSTNIWLASTDGKTQRQLTTSTKSDSHPRWSPDGKYILFQSNRSGSQQLWVIDVVGGGEARQLTNVSTGAGDAIWSPTGTHVAFVAAVYPEFSDKPFKESDALNKKKLDEIEKRPVKARVFKRLFYRHWDEYVEDRRQHLFVLKVKYLPDEPPASPTPKWEPLDVTPGDYDAFPTSTTFSSTVDFTFSPDGTHLLFTAPPKTNEAWSTNYDIWRVPISGGKPENLTKSNKAADSGPQFSPDGKKLAYRAQQKAGYEADRWELMVVDVDASGAFQGKPRSATPKFDSWVEDFVWAQDSNTIFFTAEEKAAAPIWELHVDGGVSKFAKGGTNTSLSISKDGNRLAFSSAGLDRPASIRTVGTARGAQTTLLKIDPNAELLSQLDRQRPESVTVKGEDGTPMQMWILKPPGFDEKKKWPVAYLVHGGPQGAWTDGWSYRWNPQLWAAQGYIVALPNPRGSTGFGQKYIDEISSDWGGKCYDDLMKGLDHLESLPYVDKDRIGAAGASFGGYMMNWFAVNTGRFKTLITHCSVWNFESMWATTDELWFDEWEHGGLPWEKPTSYAKYSPHKKAANLGKFKTPMLIIHNDLDFRCPIGQGHELFTTLQRQRVPSRMVNFPDEGHWVLKPANSRYWHQEVFNWLKKYVPPGGRAP
jgi:dipeptidyl aminopeptidase/acylaminoacyl peptidase